MPRMAWHPGSVTMFLDPRCPVLTLDQMSVDHSANHRRTDARDSPRWELLRAVLRD